MAPKILLLGASGYIGGTVLTQILNSTNRLVKECEVSALVRSEQQAEILQKHGVNAIRFKGLDDLDVIRVAASNSDIVFNISISYHTQSAEAIVDGLAKRQKETKKQGHLIHTSGTSNLADKPVSGKYIENAVFSDKSDIYSYERYRQSLEIYPQRTSDIAVIDKSEALGIKAYIVMPPTIFGRGTGFFNQQSIQINTMMRAALKDGYTSIVGEGEGQWNHVHVQDLAVLYELILEQILAEVPLASGKEGFYFAETGYQSWAEVAQRIATTGRSLGYLPTDEIRKVTLGGGSQKLGGGLPAEVIESSFASRSRTRADRSREIGWKPTKTRADFENTFLEEWRMVVEGIH